MTKATAPQAKFINAILKHGGYQVPGSKVFGRREDRSRNRIQDSTIEACKQRKWVIREEVGGNVLWTVTTDGRDAANPPLPISEKTEKLLSDLERKQTENAI
jgi:hypothetical protein